MTFSHLNRSSAGWLFLSFDDLMMAMMMMIMAVVYMVVDRIIHFFFFLQRGAPDGGSGRVAREINMAEMRYGGYQIFTRCIKDSCSDLHLLTMPRDSGCIYHMV